MRFLPAFHRLPQNAVNTCLISGALLLQPRDDISVKAQSEPLLGLFLWRATASSLPAFVEVGENVLEGFHFGDIASGQFLDLALAVSETFLCHRSLPPVCSPCVS